ncbi:hypothetical protein AB1Y20_018963 [Prymnesium parvum]
MGFLGLWGKRKAAPTPSDCPQGASKRRGFFSWLLGRNKARKTSPDALATAVRPPQPVRQEVQHSALPPPVHAPPPCPPVEAFTDWCEAKLVDEEIHRAVQRKAAELNDIRTLGERTAPRELLQASFGLVRNAIELLLVQSHTSLEAQQEAERVELLYEHSTLAARAAATRKAERDGLSAAVARAVGALSEPSLPVGVCAFWAELGRWRASRRETAPLQLDLVDEGILAEVASVVELPAAAAPTLLFLFGASSEVEVEGAETETHKTTTASSHLHALPSPPPSPSSHPERLKHRAPSLSAISVAPSATERENFKKAFLEASSPECRVHAPSSFKPVDLEKLKAVVCRSSSASTMNQAATKPSEGAQGPSSKSKATAGATEKKARVSQGKRADSKRGFTADDSLELEIVTPPCQHSSTSSAFHPSSQQSVEALGLAHDQGHLTRSTTESKLPFPWETVESSDGSSCLFNPHTGERRWTPPPTLLPEQSSRVFTSLLHRVCASAPLASVCAGVATSYVIGSQGELLCFGRAECGELGVADAASLEEEAGDDFDLFSVVPRWPQGLFNVAVKHISAASHVLAITSGGALYAWGSSFGGVLGIGPPERLAQLPGVDAEGRRFAPTPVLVKAFASKHVSHVSAAESHSLCCTEDGCTYSWGLSSLGRLGLPASVLKQVASAAPSGGHEKKKETPAKSIWEPELIPGLDTQKIASVSAGRAHSHARSAEGRAFSWGWARYGRLGIGSVESLPRDEDEPVQMEPRLISLLSNYFVLDISAGAAHSIALCTSREADMVSSTMPSAQAARIVFSWGLGTCGRLGVPTGPTQARAGQEEDGWMAGEAALRFASFSVDARDEEPFSSVPRRLAMLDGASVVSISSGTAHSLAVTSRGVVYGWGLATHGRVGVGKESELPEDDDGDVFVELPLRIDGLAGYEVTSVSAGDTHSIGLTSSGQLLTWGSARHGRLGFIASALDLPAENDGSSYQPLPRQIWAAAALYSQSPDRTSMPRPAKSGAAPHEQPSGGLGMACKESSTACSTSTLNSDSKHCLKGDEQGSVQYTDVTIELLTDEPGIAPGIHTSSFEERIIDGAALQTV